MTSAEPGAEEQAVTQPVLPDEPEKDSDAAWSERPESAEDETDERLQRERPPHHDRWLDGG